jgi:hypothetical protein
MGNAIFKHLEQLTVDNCSHDESIFTTNLVDWNVFGVAHTEIDTQN